MTRWLSQEEQHAWRRLLRLINRLPAELGRQMEQSSGLSTPDYEVLVPLSEAPEGRLRMFEIARELQWEQSRLSHHLRRMQQRGLICREDCESDRRGAYVALTALGRQTIESAAPAHVAAVRRLVFDSLTAAEVEMLSAISDKVLAQLDDVQPGAPRPVGGSARRSR